jgi:hypothetical protein
MSAPEHDRLREGLRRAVDASASRDLDLDVVLDESRRSRRRRRNAIAGGTASVAALIATVGLVGGLAGLGGPAMTTADAPIAGSAQELAPQTESQEADVAPRDGNEAGDVALGRLAAMNRCGEPVVPSTGADAGSPLTVTVSATAPVAAGSTGDATVTLTNAGEDTVEGSLRMTPSVAVVDADGTVVGMRPDASALSASVPVDLAPGESLELPATVEAVHCLSGRAPSALAPGDYRLTATVVVLPDDSARPALTAVAPLAPLRIE